MARRTEASPDEVIGEHFAATQAHDLEWLLATMAPERARLYSARTVDRRRLSVREVNLLSVEEAPGAVELPGFSSRYPEQLVLRVEYELHLRSEQERRDPTLKEGRQWAYFVLVREGPGRPWLIADWGT